MAKEVLNENEAAVISAVTKTEQFLEKNKKAILGCLAALVVVAAAAFCVYNYIYMPKKAEALQQMSKAEANFRAGNYELALKGDGNVLGFEELIADYGKKAGNSVYFYAAVCAYELGENEAALDYIGKYNGKDNTLAGRAEALKGDAYSNLGNLDKAVAAYEKAAKVSDNLFSAAYILKAGEAYEALGKDDKAKACYELIKDSYPQSPEAVEIDKYISRLEVK